MTSTQDHELDPLGQLSSLRIYTQIAFFYAVDSHEQRPAISHALSTGLKKLLIAFPWLAGQVVRDAATHRFKIVHPTPDTIADDAFALPFTEKDTKRHADAETLKNLRDNSFPIAMAPMTEEVICPATTIPPPWLAKEDAPMQVMLVQVSWLVDGCVLAVLAQHQVLDGIGIRQMLKLYSKACEGVPFTHEELHLGNRRRKDLFPLLDDSYSPGEELQSQIVTPDSDPLIDDTPRPRDPMEAKIRPPWAPSTQAGWSNIVFSAESLARIKKMAMDTLPADSSVKWVSTDDALTAFIWQSVTAARQPRLYADMDVRLARAVDSRGPLGVGGEYMGMLQTMTFHTLPCEELITAPLGVVAALIRSELLRDDTDPMGIAYRTRALATALDKYGDTTPAGTLNLSASIGGGKGFDAQLVGEAGGLS